MKSLHPSITLRSIPEMDVDGQKRQDKIVKKLLALRPATGNGKANVSPATGLKRIEARGLKTINKPDTVPEKPAHTVVLRYWYESRGGELLAFDTAPMSVVMAEREKISRPPNDWKKVVMIAANRRHRTTQEQGYRLITLPSQAGNGQPESIPTPKELLK